MGIIEIPMENIMGNTIEPLNQKGQTATLEEHQRALYLLLEELDRVCRKRNIRYVLFAGSMLGAVRYQGFVPWDDDLDVLMLREEYERFLAEAGSELDCQRFYLQREFGEHWPMFFSKLRLNGTTCLEKYHPKDVRSHQGVYIDIFPCDRAADCGVVRKLQFFASKVVIAKSLDARGYETDSKAKKLFMAGCRLVPLKPFLSLCQHPMGKARGYVHTFLGASSRFGKSVYQRDWLESSVLMKFEGGRFPVPAAWDPLLTVLYGDYRRLPSEADRACKVHAVLVDLKRSYEEYGHYRDGLRFDGYTRSIR